MTRRVGFLCAVLAVVRLSTSGEFFEDFSQGIGSWHVLKISAGGDTTLDSVGSDKHLRVRNPSTSPALLIMLKPALYRDLHYSVKMRVDTAYHHTTGICFGATGNLGGYYFGLNRDPITRLTHCSLFKIPDGGGTSRRLVYLPVTVESDNFVRLSVGRIDSAITLFVDDFKVATVIDKDTSLAAGRVGLFVPERVTARYDDMEVQLNARLPATASCFSDTFASGGIGGWSTALVWGTAQVDSTRIEQSSGSSRFRVLRITTDADTREPSLVYRSGNFKGLSFRTTASFIDGDSAGGYGIALIDVVSNPDLSYRFNHLFFLVNGRGGVAIVSVDSLDSVRFTYPSAPVLTGTNDTLEVLLVDSTYTFRANGVVLQEITIPAGFVVDGVGMAVMPGMSVEFAGMAGGTGEDLSCPVVRYRAPLGVGESRRQEIRLDRYYTVTGRLVYQESRGVRKNVAAGVYMNAPGRERSQNAPGVRTKILLPSR